MNGSNCRSHFVRHILVTFMVAIGICGVFAALGCGDNIPLILLAAPVVGALEGNRNYAEAQQRRWW